MLRIIRADNGMNIAGQGIWILLVTVPAAATAIAVHLYAPELARIPLPRSAALAIGFVLITAGTALWLTAVSQLLIGFSHGRLVTRGAYGVCRNPVYASFGLFILPGLSLVSRTWVYFAVAGVLCLAVHLLIGKEEQDLLRVFGDEYRDYTRRVRRIMPLAKP